MSSILRSKIVVSRKSHECFGCLSIIPKGERIQFNVCIDMGMFNTYVCLECVEYIKKEGYEEFGHGDLYERREQ